MLSLEFRSLRPARPDLVHLSAVPVSISPRRRPVVFLTLSHLVCLDLRHYNKKIGERERERESGCELNNQQCKVMKMKAKINDAKSPPSSFGGHDHVLLPRTASVIRRSRKLNCDSCVLCCVCVSMSLCG